MKELLAKGCWQLLTRIESRTPRERDSARGANP